MKDLIDFAEYRTRRATPQTPPDQLRRVRPPKTDWAMLLPPIVMALTALGAAYLAWKL